MLILAALPARAQEEGEGLSVEIDREVERATDTSPGESFTVDDPSIVASSAWPGSQNGDYEGVVTKVLDGDTIEVDGERMRLLGVNAPEYENGDNDCFALEATKELESLVLGKAVTYSFDRGYGRRDRYGDTRIYLYRGDVFINAYLIEYGFAFVDPSKDYHMQEELEPLQVVARRKNLGLWHACPVECNRGDICRTRNWSGEAYTNSHSVVD